MSLDVRIQAALIAAICTLVGVIIGGVIQIYLKDRDISRAKGVAEGAVCIYLCNLRNLFEDFSEEDKTFRNLSLGISVNDNNIQEVNKVIEIIENYDAFLIVKLFDIRQRLHNIRLCSNRYYELRDSDKPYNKLQNVVRYLNVDAKGGLMDVNECIKYTFNEAEDKTKSRLLKNDDFTYFLEALLGDEKFKYYIIKLGINKKI